MAEEKLLRFEAPALYNRMVETLSAYHIHPYDVQATALKDERGLDVSLRFSANFSQLLTKRLRFEQAENPDEDVICFFKEAADKCKSSLITNYFKMIKP